VSDWVRDIVSNGDGTLTATITDGENGDVIVTVTYDEGETGAYSVGEIVDAGVLRRIWNWVTG
jgi:hypothetical protein